ncbi:MAG: hypothetical protein L0216_11935 [Planctomycetales bacterium]|nr:hypothetical protein [Planctomycetales bacterium]
MKVGVRKGFPVAWLPAGSQAGREVTFEARLEPGSRRPTPAELRTDRWPGLLPLAAFRSARATPVRVRGNLEAGLAYEAALPVALAFSAQRRADGTVLLRNGSGIPLQGLFLVPPSETTRAVRIGTLPPGSERIVSEKPEAAELVPLADALRLDLGSLGLFPDEAAALATAVLSTDFTSGVGVRLVARVPREVWDGLFPLEISPAPRQLVRVGLLRFFEADRFVPSADEELPVPAGATPERVPEPRLPSAAARH